MHTLPSLFSFFALSFFSLFLATGPARAHVPPPVVGEVSRPSWSEHYENRGPMCQLSWHDAQHDRLLPDRMGVLLLDPPTEEEGRLVEGALDACAEIRGPVERVADPFQILALLRLEEELGVPEEARSLLVAAWCVETALRPEPSKGDYFWGDYRNGTALASGNFQLHPNVWQKTCQGTQRAPHDLLWAASCWWTQILKTQEKASRISGCRERDMLRVAEAAASNIRRYGWRCDSKSAHWRMLERIQKNTRSG